MTSLSGRGSLAVTITNDDYHRVPSIDNSDWYAEGNYLEISYKDIQAIMKKYSMKSYDNVEISIEILSLTGTGKFTLDITTDSYKKRSILHGLP